MAAGKRERLILAATDLFHMQGISGTSIADIANEADVPVGNVYYYFKTKEELGLAAAEERLQQSRDFIASLNNEFQSPKERIRAAIRFFDEAKDEYAKYGCPIAQICQVADTQKDDVARAYARVFKDYTEWMAGQFGAMGFDADVAEEYAHSILVRMQGSVVVAKAMQDSRVIAREVEATEMWFDSLHVSPAIAA